MAHIEVPASRTLTERQRRELEFHRDFALKNSERITQPVDLDIVRNPKRKWWNAYWTLYSKVRAAELFGKRILIVGCGFGEDAFRLAALGAEVYAIDLSPDIINIARERSVRLEVRIHFDAMPAEQMSFADDFFDGAFFVDILHHVDIPRAVREVTRVLKPNAWIFGDELYTHSILQKIRGSRFVSHFLYPRMVRYIYGTATPYITADEHKIDEHEFSVICRCLHNRGSVQFFYLGEGRLYPSRWAAISKIDRICMWLLGPAGKLLAARVVFTGKIAK